ncbi:MAG: glutamine-hydrolyzing carbamoyl-phosphate synthase small subunit [Clostridia bacterium]|nr:glutamine-hydrolyzing carbamoyl-phosphate synthase small subunit [Clostridia bacterium]
MKKRYLVLSDGTVFEGYAFGADKTAIGELIFNTNAVGYIETLTDPTYYGQIVLQTFPMIGNYGIIESDFIGETKLSGYVVREWCQAPSNFRCEYDIDKFLKDKGVPGIYGVDTRELTYILRENGSTNAIICDEVPASLDEVKNYKIVGAVENTGSQEVSVYLPKTEIKKHIALVDLGSSKNLEVTLMDKGYKVTVVPYNFKAEDVLALGADGVILTEGPGDPKDYMSIAEEIKGLFGKLPMFGMGLGHQLMALSQGADTYKLSYGHHGSNQPAKIAGTARSLVISQNHGYVVCKDSIKKGEVSYYSVNDGTVEGIAYKADKAFSVQFEPTDEIIAEFLKGMEE